MKNVIISVISFFMATFLFAQNDNQVSLKFNTPYISNNRTVILQADRIPSDFLGCTIGVTSEVDALKNINQLGLRCSPETAGVSELLYIKGDIECEGAKFGGVSLWFYNNIFWKILFTNMKTDSEVLAKIIRKKYSKFPQTNEKIGYDYIRYRGNGIDLVHNKNVLEYIISGGSAVRWEEQY